jgi:hypothetical protein
MEGEAMVRSEHRENGTGEHHTVDLSAANGSGSAPRPGGAPARRNRTGGAAAMVRGLRLTRWATFVLSALTAFIIAGGSAVLGAITVAKEMPAGYGWLCLGVLTGLVAMANDIRSQLNEPPVDVRS